MKAFKYLSLNYFKAIVLLLTLMVANLSWSEPITSWEKIEQNIHPYTEKMRGLEAFEKINVSPQPGQVVLVNYPLLKELGLLPLDAKNILTEELKRNILSNFSIEVSSMANEENNNKPFATYYADGGIGFAGGKGDGRALWLSQLRSQKPESEGQLYDISIKGSGTTGLGYSGLAGHTDGLSHIADALQEYYVGEQFSRMGLSDASRILAIIKTEKGKTLADGQKAESAIMVRVSPTNLRFAHIWRYGNNRYKMTKLLSYLFETDHRFKGLTFNQACIKLLEINIQTTAREAAILESFNIAHLSPTRGNRLITGELIDFGTVLQTQVINWNLYKSIWLGALAQQKKHLSYWNKQLKTQLEKLIGSVVYDTEAQFNSHFLKQQTRLTLVRMGFNDNQIKYLMEHHTEEVRLINQAINTLKSTQTNKKIGVPGRKYKRTVFDIRKFLKLLPYAQMETTLWASNFELNYFVDNFGTQNTRHSYGTGSVIKALEVLKTYIPNIVSYISDSEQKTKKDILRRLSGHSYNRNQGQLPKDQMAKIARMNEWAKVVRQGTNISELTQILDRQISETIDFETSPRTSLATSNHEQLYLKYLHLGQVPSGIRSEFMISNGLRNSHIFQSAAYGQGNSRTISLAELNLIIDNLYTMSEESKHAAVIRSGLNAARVNHPQSIKIIYELLQMYSSEFDTNIKTLEETIAFYEQTFSRLPIIHELEVSGTNKVLLRIKGDSTYVAAEGIDIKTQQVIFRDGIREIYKSRSRNEITLSSSFLTSYTDPQFRSMGLYRLAISYYRQLHPKILTLFLNSENKPTLEFLFLLESALKSKNVRSKLLDILAVRNFLESFAVQIDDFRDGNSAELSKAKDAFIKLTLQGRVRVQSNWSFEVVNNNFATFQSRILSDEEKNQTIKAIAKFEQSITDTLSLQDLQLLKSVFSFDYISSVQMKKRKNSHVLDRQENSCKIIIDGKAS